MKASGMAARMGNTTVVELGPAWVDPLVVTMAIAMACGAVAEMVHR